jgi:hypothetical protein
MERASGASARADIRLATVLVDSALTFIDVQIRFLTPRLVIAHMRWTTTGANSLRGQPQPRRGTQTLVVQKQVREWLIDAFQSTNAPPER